jgi:hypothetical protein
MSTSNNVTRLLTRKGSLAESRIDARPIQPLQDGEALLKLDRFALTTNNITYAAFGDSMQYWGFFPTGDAEWGHMPVWGFADVVESTVPGLEIGERFYGYFPIASHLRVKADRVTQRGFYDVAEHRLPLTSAYNQYTRCSSDPYYSTATEDLQALLRPLFITSFMLADFLEDNDHFGATRLVFSSASSKTAYGTAFCLQDSGIETVALTSARNQAFVDRIGCYGSSVTYDQLDTLPADRPTLYVDFSGDLDLRSQIHHHFGSQLVYSCFAGSAQTTEVPRQIDLPGPEPVFYFAPVQIRKRNADWGPPVVNQRFGEATQRFFAQVGDPANPWLRVVENQGFEAAEKLIDALHSGSLPPEEGYMVRLG